MNSYNLRYGNNYQIVLAIVLPILLTIYPFILIMQRYPNLGELNEYIIIFSFLAGIILFTFWLVLSIYPPVVLRIDKNEISISFPKKNILTPSDFTLKPHEIKSFSSKNIFDFKSIKNGLWLLKESKADNYMLLKTKVRPRRFQLSANSYSDNDQLSFNNAAAEINKFISQNL